MDGLTWHHWGEIISEMKYWSELCRMHYSVKYEEGLRDT